MVYIAVKPKVVYIYSPVHTMMVDLLHQPKTTSSSLAQEHFVIKARQELNLQASDQRLTTVAVSTCFFFFFF